ncbi:MAG: hypothetical protein V1793_21730 [Pseudomonadota bacterium]
MKFYGWPLQIFFSLLSAFFALFGVDLLLGSYSLGDPFSFVITFFAASLMVLISLTLLAGFVIRMVLVYRQTRNLRNP